MGLAAPGHRGSKELMERATDAAGSLCSHRETHESLSPLSYQGIEDEDVILITLRMLHHDVEEGIQSVLEKLDKRTKVTFRESADGQGPHPYLPTQENECTATHATFERSTREPGPGATLLSMDDSNVTLQSTTQQL